jgi:hypothetical protein
MSRLPNINITFLNPHNSEKEKSYTGTSFKQKTVTFCSGISTLVSCLFEPVNSKLGT